MKTVAFDRIAQDPQKAIQAIAHCPEDEFSAIMLGDAEATQAVQNALTTVQAACRAVSISNGWMDRACVTDAQFAARVPEDSPYMMRQALAAWQIAGEVPHDEVSRDVFANAAGLHIRDAAMTLQQAERVTLAGHLRSLADHLASTRDYGVNLGMLIAARLTAETRASVTRHGADQFSQLLRETDNPPGDIKAILALRHLHKTVTEPPKTAPIAPARTSTL